MDILIRQQWQRAYRAALQITGDPGLAEDAVQEGLATAWQKRDQLRKPGAFGAWLSQIVRRIALRTVQQTVRVLPMEGVEPHTAAAETLGLHDAIERALEKLSPEHRQVVEWVEMDGLSCMEVAHRLKLPPGTVRSRLHYAKKILQEELQAWL